MHFASRMSARLSVVVVLSAGALASGLAACVSSSNPLAPGGDAGFDFDAGTQPGFDAAPGSDATTGADATAPAPDAGDAATPADGGGSNDSGGASDDAGSTDAGADASPLDAAAPDVYAPSDWSAFDTASLDGGLGSFSGVTFDGRYAYFLPYASAGSDGVVARFDTTQSFASAAAWTTFNTKVAGNLPGSGRFAGAVFDGRYVYLVPFSNSVSVATDGVDQTFVQYDTQGSFTSAASWQQYDLGFGGPFYGGSFDGRYVYFAPHWDSFVAIYDTKGAFTSASSWTTFDTSTLTPAEPSTTGYDEFAGTAFDGRYVYLLGPIPARVDTALDAGLDASAWATFDTKTIADAGLTASYFTGGYDGRYVYMVSTANSDVVQYDTTGTFISPSSWARFDVSTAGAGTTGFTTVDFDGRYLYFAPNGTKVAIYDTQAPFSAATSWTIFDTSTVTTAPSGFQNMFYDGEYMYLAEQSSTVLLRVQVKSAPGPLPALPGFRGSFF